MVLDLKELFADSREKLEFDFSFSLEDVEISGSFPFDAPIRVAGAVTSRAGILSCDYKAHYRMSIFCDRCLRPLEREYETPFSHVLVTGLQNEEDDDGERYLILEDKKLDMEQLAKDDILLSLSAKNLCKPDCLGLCPTCGKNLNEGDCGCSKKQVDPRLEALKELLEN